jgi:diguanylate cyclase (GGDEF)-like protein/PAS domain S-box-containing protein
LRLISAKPGDARLSATESPHVGVIDKIVGAVKQRVGFDLSLYKPASLERRIRRRAVATESRSLEAYAQLVQSSETEAQRVVREMFISVTQFFRDTEAFAILDAELGKLLEDRVDSEEVRIWVPGCATGEEAYSLAMLVANHCERLDRFPRVRLFATDLDTTALAKARKGTFSSVDAEEIPPDLAKKYIHIDGDTCQIVKHVRDMVIFSEHNLLDDPAFLRLDLISCRNLLIYLQPQVQDSVLTTFSRALKPDGLLFLGKAEALYANANLFAIVDSAGHLYRTTGQTNKAQPSRLRQGRATSSVPANRAPGAFDFGGWLSRAHSDGLLSPFIVLSSTGHVTHVFGDVSPFMKFGAGQASLNVLQLAIEEIRIEIRSVLLQSQRKLNQRVSSEVFLQSGAKRLQLVAMRREEPSLPTLTILLFELRTVPIAPVTEADYHRFYTDQLATLEEQISSSKDHLSTVINELESTNEELQSLNEEMQSSNEELQSANEQLETSNEELQSTNEELVTVNEELESRTDDLAILNVDLQNIKNSLSDPLIVVDEHRRVTVFNSAADSIFALDTSSTGNLLFSLPCKINMGSAALLIKEVIETNTLLECQLEGERSYLMRAQPYRNLAGECKGAVLTFLDNTELRNGAEQLVFANQQVQGSMQFTTATIDALPQQIGVVDRKGSLVSANARWRAAVADDMITTCGCLIGENFMSSLERHSPDSKEATLIANGLRQVIEGSLPVFEIEYSVKVATKTQYIRTTVTPFNQSSQADHWVVEHEDISIRKHHEALMRLQAKALDASLTPLTIADATDPNLPLVYVNSAFERMTGYSRQEVLGRNCRFLQGDDRDQPELAELRQALFNREPVRVMLRNHHKDGSLIRNELTLTFIENEGELTHVLGLQRDMTTILETEETLKASLDREVQALAFARVGSLDFDIRSSIIRLSEQHARLLGLSGTDTRFSLEDYRKNIVPEDLPFFDECLKLCMVGHGRLEMDYRVCWTDGSQHWLHTSGDAIVNSDGVATRILALSQEVSARKDMEDRAQFIAHHDALTGLPNRTLLRDRFQLALNVARRNRTRLALVFIDLDHFKDINDTLGHEVGDALLVSVAERMRTCIRDTDTVCRQSGDEFIVLLPNIRDASEAANVSEKLVATVAEMYSLRGHEVRVTCSAGVSMYPEDGDTIELLMRNADSAMYHAKSMGRNGLEFFEKAMTIKHQDRMAVASLLRNAVSRNEMQVHYQPQFDVRTGMLVGIEALVRWLHPEKGLVLPDEFIDVAEESGLIVSIGEWVLREACKQAKRWHDAGFPKVPMAVNMSPLQLRQRDVLDKVMGALKEADLASDLLEIEITERALILNPDDVGMVLNQFRSKGIQLSLDDFGTGYSSLSYLHRFPVDKLKIDRSFVAASPSDPNASAIIRSVISLAESLAIKIVAEGVETAEQLAFLDYSGCASFQGYLSGPVSSTGDLQTHASHYRAAAKSRKLQQPSVLSAH